MDCKAAWFHLGLPPDARVDEQHSATANFSITAPDSRLVVHLDKPLAIQTDHRTLDIPIFTGHLEKGQSATLTLAMVATGDIDHAPIHLAVNTSDPGRPFDGLGGNFRIQNPRLDAPVIDYCLRNLRIAWGRVELPWRFWQPSKDARPLDSAKAGRLDPAVQRAMEMARRLGKMNIPIILSAWFPPDWAVEGPVRFRPGPDHVWGNPLNHANDEAIYRSITDYILFLKQQYHTDVAYFSFNESDLGINVRQTAQEHDALIKGLGAWFARQGLATKVLLGDNSDATTWRFIDTAMADPAARPYISAVSFHSWRGWDSATLQKWADAATKLQVPLFVAEGSIDAAAWNYPAVFREPSYALREIALYIRLMAICQPASILQWQLTADYSLLAGGGIFGDTGALRPTQRFWQLKQLSLTPEGLAAMRISVDRPDIAAAALGDNNRHIYTLHLVNTGAARSVLLTGLPAGLRSFHIYTTSRSDSARAGTPVPVTGGQATFVLPAQSFVTLITE
jgi:O-glycosyl hydrolase